VKDWPWLIIIVHLKFCLLALYITLQMGWVTSFELQINETQFSLIWKKKIRKNAEVALYGTCL